MASAKKTEKTFAELVAEADTRAAEKAVLARTELAELKDNIARWNDEHAEASGRVNWIRSNLARGKEVATPQEFAEALAAEERLKFLTNRHMDTGEWYEGDKRVDVAEKNLPPAEKKLAAAVAELLADVLPGVEILSTFGKVDGKPVESDLPVAVVSQAKPTFEGTRHEREYGKTPMFRGLNLSGDVEVTLYRKPVHRELYPPKVAKHLEKQGVQLFNADSLRGGDTMSRSDAEYDIDTLRLSIDSTPNPGASEELCESYDKWVATLQTTLTETPKPISGWDVYVGTRY
ncbi:hypothetical protein ACFVWY_14725 [Streptomyces sp. NPDC058195]|uniref:hypothetical protein n=1 Tax=Streptomyces sp. NPDC058195 TaxID=3346375 RepID=UPI0036EF8FF4